MQQRLQYIDEIKGFAIFFVVVGHILEWSFCSYETGYLSPFHGLIYTFHMPLFAFVSGFLMNTSFSWKSLRKRAERLLLPMLTVGLSYAYWRGWDAMTFFTSQYKIGYWYLLVLFLAWVLSCFYQIITNISCKWKFLIDIVMSLIFITCIYICEKLMPEHINNLLSFSYMSYLLPYIFSGIIIKRHKLFDSLFGNDRLYNIVLFFLGGALIMCYALIMVR